MSDPMYFYYIPFQYVIDGICWIFFRFCLKGTERVEKVREKQVSESAKKWCQQWESNPRQHTLTRTLHLTEEALRLSLAP